MLRGGARVVALESTTLSLAKTIVQKAAAAWIADRRTAKEGKKELRALLTPRFPHAAPEQRFLDEAAAELASLGRTSFGGWMTAIAVQRCSRFATPSRARTSPTGRFLLSTSTR
jgi:hypothetical protein